MPKAAGEGMRGPWWMQYTALTREGQLELTHRPWWLRAMQLPVGESFVVNTTDTIENSKRKTNAPMLVRRERFRNRSAEVEAIVWIIDDDGDGSIISGGDTDSDCYIVDYGADGTVDRMVDYIDNDNDNDPDEMDIRYFVGGRLRQLWCGLDLDDDQAMWDLAGYEYSGDFFRSDPHGNGMIFMNRFDPNRGQWLPISECPFAFYDTDDDSFSEVVVRVSAVPLSYDSGVDPDYANDPRRYRGQWSDTMRQMGIVNIRYSFDIDNLSSEDTPLHYDFGFNLVGAEPYEIEGMDHFNPKRRPPQVTRVIPHDRLRSVADRFIASETGFSWHEHHDDTIAIGDKPLPELDYRWEGVFWIWQRRFMENTGGPNQRWNVRREWSNRPADRRQLYYSEVDRRIHLFGAQEGWIEIGHFGGCNTIGEMRMYDTDGNGYFDRWEVYLGDDPKPVRVTTVRDEKTKPVPFDDKALCDFYTRQVLPEATRLNEAFMSAMSAVHDFECPPCLTDTMPADSPTYRRYRMDVARELQYQDLRRHFSKMAHRILAKAEMNDLRRLSSDQRIDASNSQTAWRMTALLEKLDVAHGQGEYTRAMPILHELAELKETLAP